MDAEALRLLDGRLLLAVNRIDAPAWELAMGYGTALANGFALAAMLALGLRWRDPGRFPKNFLLISVAALLAGAVVLLVKEALPAPRPVSAPRFELSERPLVHRTLPGGLGVREWGVGRAELAAVSPRLKLLGPVLKHGSFPSGHTAAAFAVAAGLVYAFAGRLRWLWFVPAALLGLSRMACGVHFPSDVAGGAIVGTLASFGFLRSFEIFHGLAAHPRASAARAASGPPRVMIVAGEASADVYGARLLAALRARQPGLEAFGVGGPELARAGLERQVESRDLEIVGFTAVVTALPKIAHLLRELGGLLRRRQPDVIVCIDLPEFNGMLALQARALGIPVLFYISPQFWAWRRARPRRLAGRISRMVVAFPFEASAYRSAGVPVAFHGHPLLEGLAPRFASREAALAHFGLDPARELVVLAPGSRRSEWHHHLAPLMAAAARIAQERPGVQFAAPIAPHRDAGELQRAARAAGVTVVPTHGDVHDLFRAARLGLVCSGTATLEAALAELPMLIFYRGNWVNALLAKLLMHIDRVGLPNIVLGDQPPVFPELLQHRASGQRLAETALALLRDEAALARLREAGAEVRRRLSGGATSGAVADEVLTLASGRSDAC